MYPIKYLAWIQSTACIHFNTYIHEHFGKYEICYQFTFILQKLDTKYGNREPNYKNSLILLQETGNKRTF